MRRIGGIYEGFADLHRYFMSYSLIMCIIWILLQSPDLAITRLR